QAPSGRAEFNHCPRNLAARRRLIEIQRFSLSPPPDMPRVTELHVNRENRRVDADSERTLLSVLRDDLDLTGSKYGCGEGKCGACTVLIDGEPTRSCITPISSVSRSG